MILLGNSVGIGYQHSGILALENSQAAGYDNTIIEAFGNLKVRAHGKTKVISHGCRDIQLEQHAIAMDVKWTGTAA